MYGLSPPLPAAATVSMPSDDALSTADGQVVIERLAVVAAEGHVHDVQVVGRDAVAVRVDGPVHGSEEPDAGARRRDGGADLQGIELHAGGDALDATDDVGDVGAVALEVDRIGIRVLDAVVAGPALADEVEAARDLGRREQAVEGLVPSVVVALAVRRLVGGLGAGAAERDVGVVDAAVDDADADALAGHAGVLDRLGADVRHGLVEGLLVVDDRADRDDVRIGRELRDLGGVDPERRRGSWPAGSHPGRGPSRRCAWRC